MKTRNLSIITCAFALAALVGCGSSATNTTPSTTSSSNSSATANTTTAPPAAKPVAATPTETTRHLFDAMKSKDLAALKGFFTRKVLAVMQAEAKRQNKSLDDVLMGFIDATPVPATFNARNEKIEGEHASVETMDDEGHYSPIEFVKEDGAWKLALDDDDSK